MGLPSSFWRASGVVTSLSMGVSIPAVATAGAVEAANFCNQQITRPSTDALGYRQRGDRCEGTYEQPTSATGERVMTLISLTCGLPPPSFASRAPVSVSWPVAGPNAVALAVETLPEITLRYRMDARPLNAPFSWPSEVLVALSLSPQDLSVLVLGAPKLGEVSIPSTAVLASFGNTPNPSCAQVPLARFYTRYPLSEITVCAKDLTPSQLPEKASMCKKWPGSFSPSASVAVPLDMLKGRSGLFELSVEARKTSGSVQTPDHFKVFVK